MERLFALLNQRNVKQSQVDKLISEINLDEVNLNEYDAEGNTVLHIAASRLHIGFNETLNKHFPMFWKTTNPQKNNNHSKQSVLTLAFERVKVNDSVFEFYMDLYKKNKQSINHDFLKHLANQDYSDIEQILLKYKYQLVNQADDEGYFLDYLAASKGNYKLLEYLIKYFSNNKTGYYKIQDILRKIIFRGKTMNSDVGKWESCLSLF